MTPTEIRKLRKRMGLSQSSFAKLLGVHEVTVSRWENGAAGLSNPARTLLELLAQSPTATIPTPKQRRRKTR